MVDDWQEVMDEAAALAAKHGLEFYELRNAWGDKEIREDAEFFKDQGVTASDMNCMLHGAMRSRVEEVEELAAELECRNHILDSVRRSGQSREDALEGIRRLLAPARSGS